MRKLIPVLVVLAAMSAATLDAKPRRQAEPTRTVKVIKPTDPAPEFLPPDEPGLYIHSWVRVPVLIGDDPAVVYQVHRIVEGPYEPAPAEAALTAIVAAGGWRVGKGFFPMHTIDRLDIAPADVKPGDPTADPDVR